MAETLVLGPGLWDYIISKGDAPIEDSVFKTNSNGTQTETAQGTKGRYYATNATGEDGAVGEWKSYGPFGD